MVEDVQSWAQLLSRWRMHWCTVHTLTIVIGGGQKEDCSVSHVAEGVVREGSSRVGMYGRVLRSAAIGDTAAIG